MISPRMKKQIVQTVGKEIFYKMHPEVQKIIIIEELRKLKSEMTMKFGTYQNYLNWYVKQQGYESFYHYNMAMLKLRGYETSYEYQNEMAQKAGFKSRWYYLKDKWEKKRIDRPIMKLSQRARKKGFSSFKEYENHLAREKGFDDRNDYRRFMNIKSKYCKTYSDEQIRQIQLKKECRT